MAIYASNVNGDWWEIVEGVSDELFILNSSNPEIIKAMKDDDVLECDDKFEYFIQEYGDKIKINL
jgi:hypothetical protein